MKQFRRNFITCFIVYDMYTDNVTKMRAAIAQLIRLFDIQQQRRINRFLPCLDHLVGKLYTET
jgi:hypothetical protein